MRVVLAAVAAAAAVVVVVAALFVFGFEHWVGSDLADSLLEW